MPTLETQVTELKQEVTTLHKLVRALGLELRTLKKGEALNAGAWIGLNDFVKLTGCTKGTAYNYSHEGTITTRKGPGGLQFNALETQQLLESKTKLKKVA